jgi:hypothetical protein
MGGISSQYTQFEKVEISTGYATYVPAAAPDPAYWNITLSIKNSGSAAATLTHVFVNDVPVAWSATFGVAGEIVASVDPDNVLVLESGQAKRVFVYVTPGGVQGDLAYYLSSGTTVNIKLHSAGGMDYIKLVRLP